MRNFLKFFVCILMPCLLVATLSLFAYHSLCRQGISRLCLKCCHTPTNQPLSALANCSSMSFILLLVTEAAIGICRSHLISEAN